ncbi:hypothetical protein NEHOM01_1635 [Nematocida homosporus]|uniref:uncharacterized protein n=1 Tax=Nematocida homosporus TaxID=1912981 RepID=UPI00221FCC99|nr:uncharacterized protein NEHOM01_1635 [Nematocida homosporus]KAI5186682.1 hypothetical protein NEHOM01_1635 [Nematocida homosporus]
MYNYVMKNGICLIWFWIGLILSVEGGRVGQGVEEVHGLCSSARIVCNDTEMEPIVDLDRSYSIGSEASVTTNHSVTSSTATSHADNSASCNLTAAIPATDNSTSSNNAIHTTDNSTTSYFPQSSSSSAIRSSSSSGGPSALTYTNPLLKTRSSADWDEIVTSKNDRPQMFPLIESMWNIPSDSPNLSPWFRKSLQHCRQKASYRLDAYQEKLMKSSNRVLVTLISPNNGLRPIFKLNLASCRGMPPIRVRRSTWPADESRSLFLYLRLLEYGNNPYDYADRLILANVDLEKWIKLALNERPAVHILDCSPSLIADIRFCIKVRQQEEQLDMSKPDCSEEVNEIGSIKYEMACNLDSLLGLRKDMFNSNLWLLIDAYRPDQTNVVSYQDGLPVKIPYYIEMYSTELFVGADLFALTLLHTYPSRQDTVLQQFTDEIKTYAESYLRLFTRLGIKLLALQREKSMDVFWLDVLIKQPISTNSTNPPHTNPSHTNSTNPLHTNSPHTNSTNPLHANSTNSIPIQSDMLLEPEAREFMWSNFLIVLHEFAPKDTISIDMDLLNGPVVPHLQIQLSFHKKIVLVVSALQIRETDVARFIHLYCNPSHVIVLVLFDNPIRQALARYKTQVFLGALDRGSQNHSAWANLVGCRAIVSGLITAVLSFFVGDFVVLYTYPPILILFAFILITTLHYNDIKSHKYMRGFSGAIALWILVSLSLTKLMILQHKKVISWPETIFLCISFMTMLAIIGVYSSSTIYHLKNRGRLRRLQNYVYFAAILTAFLLIVSRLTNNSVIIDFALDSGLPLFACLFLLIGLMFSMHHPNPRYEVSKALIISLVILFIVLMTLLLQYIQNLPKVNPMPLNMG